MRRRWVPTLLALLVGIALAVVLVAVTSSGGDGGGDDPPTSPAALSGVLQAEYDYDPDQARCVADQVFARLTDEEVTEVRELLAEGSELPADLERKLRAALVPCA